jgi:excisionase family DNA binding protein
MAKLLEKPFIPTDIERAAARKDLALLVGGKGQDKTRPYVLETPTGERVEVSEGIFNVLLEVFSQVSKGNAVTIMPIQAELSTIQAARLLNVSRPYLIKLLEQNQIKYRLVGRHRKVSFKDLLRYKDARDVEQLRAIAELTAADDEIFGLG